MRERSRRSRGIDYGKEVPFEVKPAAGFYDTSGERRCLPPAYPLPARSEATGGCRCTARPGSPGGAAPAAWRCCLRGCLRALATFARRFQRAAEAATPRGGRCTAGRAQPGAAAACLAVQRPPGKQLCPVPASSVRPPAAHRLGGCSALRVPPCVPLRRLQTSGWPPRRCGRSSAPSPSMSWRAGSGGWVAAPAWQGSAGTGNAGTALCAPLPACLPAQVRLAAYARACACCCAPFVRRTLRRL
jgi:hypothetical protein